MFFIILYLLSNILKGLLVKVDENFFNFNFKCWYCFLMFKFSLEVFKIKVRILVCLICFKKLIFKFFSLLVSLIMLGIFVIRNLFFLFMFIIFKLGIRVVNL